MARKTVGIQHWVALLATIFVVGGVVAVVHTKTGRDGSPQGIQASDAVLQGRVVVFEEEGTVHIIDGETGVELQECALSGATRIVDVTAEGITIGISSGERVRIGFDCIALEDVEPTNVFIEEEEVKFTDGTSVPLVAGNGRPFRDAQIIGWMDAAHVGIVAFRGDERHAIAASTDGTLTTLTVLPEFVGGFATGGGAFWYVSASPGSGIEFGPRGPSAIHRVDLDGNDVALVREETSVFEGLSVSPEGAYAYLIGGTLMVGEGEHVVNAGIGIPTGWTEDNRAIVGDRQGRISFRAMDGTITETSITLPSNVVEVWSVDVRTQAR